MRSRAVLVSGVIVLCVGALTSCTQSTAAGVTLEDVPRSSSSVAQPSFASSAATSSAQSPPSAAAGQPGSREPAMGSAETTAIGPATETSTSTEELSSQEAADRMAIEAQWVKSWEVIAALPHTPEGDRADLVAEVAIEPATANALTDAQTMTSRGWDSYGIITHRVYWPQPVNGKSSAVIGDCQDTSKAGSVEISTGNKKTVGVARNNLHGSLIRGDDGIWRVEQVYFLKDEPC